MISVGQVVRNAAVFNPRNWTVGMNSDSLLDAVRRLFSLLRERKVNYVLVGGIAMLSYVEGRNTEDVDLIMSLASLEKLPEIKIISQDMYFARGMFDTLQIDLLLTKNPLFDVVRKKHISMQHFVEQDIPTATVDGLLLLKLYALPSLYRQGNFSRVGIYENDIAALLFNFRPPMEPVLKELSRHLGEPDMASVRDILAEIEQRIARFQGKKSSS